MYMDYYEQELHIAKAAIKTTTGAKSSDVIRNLARALNHTKQTEKSLSIYNAAIIMNEDEVFSCLWSRSMPGVNNNEFFQRTMTVLDRDQNQIEQWWEIGVIYHNDLRLFEEAKLYLEKAFSLQPGNISLRDALSITVGAMRGPREAENVKSPDYNPTIDDTTVMNKVHQAHHDLIKIIIESGPIEFEGIVLFTPEEMPEWIERKFSDLA
jgi:tetratricopeptide (TPR) repeat protein